MTSTREIRTHAEWCRRLRRLGILRADHLACQFTPECVAKDEEDD